MHKQVISACIAAGVAGILWAMAFTSTAHAVKFNLDGVEVAPTDPSESAGSGATNAAEGAAFAASSSEDFAITNLQYNALDIIRGRLYIPDTNDQPFSATATLTFYKDSDRRGEDAIWRADLDVAVVLTTVPSTAGTNLVTVADPSPFAANDLILIMGGTEEFARVESVSGSDLILESNLVNPHEGTNGVSLAPEFGGFSLYDGSASNTVWGRITYADPQTVVNQVWLEYKQ